MFVVEMAQYLLSTRRWKQKGQIFEVILHHSEFEASLGYNETLSPSGEKVPFNFM